MGQCFLITSVALDGWSPNPLMHSSVDSSKNDHKVRFQKTLVYWLRPEYWWECCVTQSLIWNRTKKEQWLSIFFKIYLFIFFHEIPSFVQFYVFFYYYKPSSCADRAPSPVVQDVTSDILLPEVMKLIWWSVSDMGNKQSPY